MAKGEDDKDKKAAEPLFEEVESHDPEVAGRLGRLTKRLLERGDDARLLLGTVLDTSDRAKDQVVKLIAREVRTYLEALELTDGLREFATSHSLEIKASLSLKPLKKEPEEEEEARDPEEPE